MHKIINNLAPPPLREFVQPQTVTRYITRSTKAANCVIPARRTVCGRNGLYTAIRGWNGFCPELKGITSHNLFAAALKEQLLASQKCVCR